MTKKARSIPAGLQVVPSLLSADFARLREEIADVTRAGARMLHLDVMDGAFVPEITFGQPVMRSIRRVTELFLDAHLMIRDPLRSLELFAGCGVDLLTLHAEALDGHASEAAPSPAALASVAEARRMLSGRGCGLGLSFKPATDPRPWLEQIGELCDLVLVMTVEPGFGGQRFMEDQLPKIAAVAKLRDSRGWSYRIEVDGGVGAATAAGCISAGGELLVAGSAVFGEADRAAAVAAIRGAKGC